MNDTVKRLANLVAVAEVLESRRDACGPGQEALRMTFSQGAEAIREAVGIAHTYRNDAQLLRAAPRG